MGEDAGAGDRQPAAPESLDGIVGGVTAGMLRETFAAWTITETGGVLTARRGGTFDREGPGSLILPCVTSPTAQGLAGQLCLQAWLGRLTGAELEAVWRQGVTAVPA